MSANCKAILVPPCLLFKQANHTKLKQRSREGKGHGTRECQDWEKQPVPIPSTAAVPAALR